MTKSGRQKRPRGRAKAVAAVNTKNTHKLPSVYRLIRQTLQLLWGYRSAFAKIALVYGLISFVLVQGLSASGGVGDLKDALSDSFQGAFGTFATGIGVYSILVGSAGTATTGQGSVYQFFIVIIASLATIWALRQALVETKPDISAKAAYYNGMYPLVPFMLVVMVIGLQLIPLLVGSTLFSTVIGQGVAVTAGEQVGWAVLYALLAGWTIYMLGASLFALYVVTLPGMTPLKALRSARDLVKGRRWTMLRKIISLPLVLLVVAAVVMVPVIILLAPVAQVVFLIVSSLSLVIVHAYMYILYREALRE